MLFLCGENHVLKVSVRNAALPPAADILAKPGSALSAKPNKLTNTKLLLRETYHLVSQPLLSLARQELSITHWYTNVITTKISELWFMLIKSSLLIYVLPKNQTFWKDDKTPSIESFTTISKAWKELNGGGLQLFVQTDLTFEKRQSNEHAGLKIQTIRIRTPKTRWIHLHNDYLPNADI